MANQKKLSEMTVEDLQRYQGTDNYRALVDKIEKAGYPLTYNAVIVNNGSTGPRLTAENIYLAVKAGPIFKTAQERKNTLAELEKMNTKKSSATSQEIILKDVARSMNDAIDAEGKSQILKLTNADTKRKFELILFILLAESVLSNSYKHYAEARRSSKQSPSLDQSFSEPNVADIDFGEEINETIQITNQILDNDEIGKEGDEEDSDEITKEGEEIKKDKCGLNIPCKKPTDMCDLDAELCEPSTTKTSHKKIRIGNNLFYGSDEALKKLQECNLDKNCENSNQYCDLQEYQCIDKKEDADIYGESYVDIGGKKFYGSSAVLKQLKGYCNFDKPCDNPNEMCVLEKHECGPINKGVPKIEKTSFEKTPGYIQGKDYGGKHKISSMNSVDQFAKELPLYKKGFVNTVNNPRKNKRYVEDMGSESGAQNMSKPGMFTPSLPGVPGMSGMSNPSIPGMFKPGMSGLPGLPGLPKPAAQGLYSNITSTQGTGLLGRPSISPAGFKPNPNFVDPFPKQISPQLFSSMQKPNPAATPVINPYIKKQLPPPTPLPDILGSSAVMTPQKQITQKTREDIQTMIAASINGSGSRLKDLDDVRNSVASCLGLSG